MKKTCKFIFLSLFVLLVVVSLAIAACTPNHPYNGLTHEHTFSAQWSNNDIEHWHQADCGHDVISERAPHTFVNDTCSVCGYQKNVNLTDFTFKSVSDGYSLTGYSGSAQHINIPDKYNGLPVVKIGDMAFRSLRSVTSVTIPDTVTTICYQAFDNCSNLESVNFGKNSQLNSIDLQAFNHCSSLKSITIPDSVTIIGSDAFSDCYSLTTITIPDHVTSIVGNAFYGCSNLESVNFGNNSKLDSIGSGAFYDCDSLTEITIPDSVTSIDESAFYDCNNLVSVNFGKNSKLNSIGNYAFVDCYSLTSIIIPESVTYIGWSAFSYSYSLVIYCEASEQPTDWNQDWNELDNNNLRCPVVWNCKYDNVADDGYIYDIVDGIRYGFKNGEAKVIGNNYSGTINIPSSISFQDNEYLVTSIGNWAFYNCNGLTSVIIPDRVKSIDKDAFDGCYSLVVYSESFRQPSDWDQNWNELDNDDSRCPVVWNCKYNNVADDGYVYDVVDGIHYGFKDGKAKVMGNNYSGTINIPSNVIYKDKDYSVTSIGDWSFYNCNSLKSIIIPDSVISIGNHVFSGCFNLTSITIPDSVTYIGECDFSDCRSLQYNISNGIKYLGNNENKYLVLVDVRDIYAITYNIENTTKIINLNAFSNCNMLTSVTIPDSVTRIGNGAFNGCDNLESVNFGDDSKLNSIGDSAFYDCKSLISITIPESITNIGNFAFYNCYELKSITISDSVTSIGEYAFYDCNNLESVNFGKNSKLNSIGNKVFEGCYSLTSITIPNSVTSIGDGAFSDCSLMSITIPDSVTRIGDRAFDGCDNLESVNFGKNSKLDSIGSGAFYDCDSLTEITIPDSVTSIGEYAFYDCNNLVSVKFGTNSKLDSIGDEAFFGCYSLTSIIIPESVTYIGWSAFSYSYKLVIYCETFGQPLGWAQNWNVIDQKKDVIYEDIYSPVVWNCKKSNVADDGYIYDIVDGMRYGFKNGEAKVFGNNYSGTINIPSKVSYKGKEYAVTSIGNYSFYKCDINSITIPASVTRIGDGAFYDCDSLTEIAIPVSVTTICYNAFNNCSNLESVSFGTNSKLDSIGSYAFSSCDELTSITIPDSVTSIGDGAFSDCSLMSITIPDSVTRIGDRAFDGCDNLESVNFGKNSRLNSIGNYTFEDCYSLTSITIPDSVISIGEKSFSRCYNLESVKFGTNSKLDSIGYEAFRRCSDLLSITIPDSVTTISAGAFFGCNNLATVNIGTNSKLDSIGSQAFSWCDLTSITIPSSVTSIGYQAFYSCENLRNVTFENPEGWKAGNTNLTLDNPSKNAEYLTQTYCDDDWTRK